MTFNQFFYYIGLLTAARLTYKTSSFFYPYLRSSSLPRYLRDNDSWALVTGSTSGIGIGFAHELCHRGFNIVLHGRNLEKLDRIKDELSQKYPARSFRIVVADALDVASSVDKIVATVQGINLTVLLNNIGGVVGIISPEFKTLVTHTTQEVDDLITRNDRFMTHLTRALIPVLECFQPSLILNVGSLGSALGFPYLSVYSAAKAYNLSFSSNLKAELKAEGKNIEVLCILIGDTQTDLRPSVVESAMMPSSRTTAKAVLDKVGCGKSAVVGYLPHALQLAFMTSLPQGLAHTILEPEAKKLRAKAERDAKEE